MAHIQETDTVIPVTRRNAVFSALSPGCVMKRDFWKEEGTLPSQRIRYSQPCLCHTPHKLITQGRISQPVPGKEVGFTSNGGRLTAPNKQNIDLLCKPDRKSLSFSLSFVFSMVPLRVCQMMILAAQKIIMMKWTNRSHLLNVYQVPAMVLSAL